MIVKKFFQFINEDVNDFQDPPEEFIKTKLMKLKKSLEDIFADVEMPDENKVMTLDDAKEAGKKKERIDKGSISFRDMNVRLESSEISKFSSIYDSLKVIFSDEENRYDLYITIPLQDGMNKNMKKDFSDKDIEEATYKFKKYDINNFELLGQIGPKKVKISDINEDFLIEIKIEIDDEYNNGEEKIEFET